ncbi:MAG: hypothetical protein N2596_05180 [Syntrophorhabdaceae bacterium]|nr:hypothetical protein [Syntrophorhabdaceae bacterium]
MQSRLEDILKNKERELKLYQRFLELKRVCEEEIFPSSNLPLKKHVEDLKTLIETLLPEPRDRTEEMFSGEIFTLLGIIYLHDIDKLREYRWKPESLILKNIFNYNKGIIKSNGLRIPEVAIEVISYFSFSNKIKMLPIELEITEDNKKALIRNTRVIGHIFNFAHLLYDIFYSDVKFSRLRRFNESKIFLRKEDVDLSIESREGIISIGYNAKFPYEIHMLNNAKSLINDMFFQFKEYVNGKFGINYKEIIWNIKSNFNYERDIFEIPRFSPYNEFEGPPVERWEKASIILDKLFNNGSTIVVGDESIGKTTLLKSFVMPQLFLLSKHVFYCDIWEKPVSELRNIICKKYSQFSQTGLDIISICKRLLEDEPLYFIIDNCERYINLTKAEQEKFERFIKFCIDHDEVFIIASGDKSNFFDWFKPFEGVELTSVCEVKPIKGAVIKDTFDGERLLWESEVSYKPIELVMMRAKLNPENVLHDLLKDIIDEYDFRSLMAVLVDKKEKVIRRFTIEDLYEWTCIPKKRITGYLNTLKDRDLVLQRETPEQIFYHLSGRHLIDPLYKVLRLYEFEDRKRLKNRLNNAIVNKTLLGNEDLKVFERWQHNLIFSKEENGVILASLLFHSETYEDFLEKAINDGKGIDIQPILQLLYLDDVKKRTEVVKVLIKIKDKDMINPLLEHLKKEDEPEIKDLLIQGICITKKKRAMLAIINTLKEIGDKQLLLKAIDFFFYLLGPNSRGLLLEIKDNESDPLIIEKIDQILSTV